MNSTILKIFTAFMSLQMLLVTSQVPENCPVCRCPSTEQRISFEPPASVYSKESNDDLMLSASAAPQLGGPIHMGPNEIAESAQLFSREILKVSNFF